MKSQLVFLNKRSHLIKTIRPEEKTRQVVFTFHPAASAGDAGQRFQDLMALYTDQSGITPKFHWESQGYQGTLHIPETVPYEKWVAILVNDLSRIQVLDKRGVGHIKTKCNLQSDKELGIDYGRAI